MTLRGLYKFEVSDNGDIIYSNNNVELLRRLWLDSEIIKPGGPGPGRAGDFTNGAWHAACHLVAAGGVRRTEDGNIGWLEISFNKETNTYIPTLTIREDNNIQTIDLKSTKAINYLNGSELLGFIEGNSEGRISARGVEDSRRLFNSWTRQEFDKSPGSTEIGGKVWEHWCTTRDIRKSSIIGTSVLQSFVALSAWCGDRFMPTVARGRMSYQHPIHLKAMVEAGFTSNDSAKWNVIPTQMPNEECLLLQEATPKDCLIAAERLDWSEAPKYYMYPRKINSWNSNPDL